MNGLNIADDFLSVEIKQKIELKCLELEHLLRLYSAPDPNEEEIKIKVNTFKMSLTTKETVRKQTSTLNSIENSTVEEDKKEKVKVKKRTKHKSKKRKRADDNDEDIRVVETKSPSPDIRRHPGSPSHLDRRRITSARKRPVPYRRPTPSKKNPSPELAE